MFRSSRISLAAAIAAFVALPAGMAYSTGVLTPKQARMQGLVTTTQQHEQKIDRLIVKLRSPKGVVAAGEMSAVRAQSMAKSAGLGMKTLRMTAGGAHLMQLDRAVPLSEARAIAARLGQEADVEYAEPNVRYRALLAPTETRYAQWQWNLFAPTTSYTANSITTTTGGGANLPPAWEYTTGSESVIVAVIDSGIVNHPDLNGVASGAIYTPAGRFLPGYDFIASNALGLPANFVANDGNGRDADPSDPGDWITAQEKALYVDECTMTGETAPYEASDSSWHGSHVAGIVAATANNGVGIAGIGWNVRVVPIRALGKCGGELSDIEEAIRWAAGLTVGGVPANPYPAKVINLSLGGGDTCGPTMQSAVTAAINAGAVIVAATGNGEDVVTVSPANCSGVIGVTAHAINGENAEYANIGPGTALSAPGGGPPIVLGRSSAINNPEFDGYYIFSSVLFGATMPTSTASSGGNAGPAYTGFVGTSAASPQVAGVAALLASSVPTAQPSDIRSYLLNVRAYPTGSACAPGGGLFATGCGAGLLDAGLALAATGNSASPAAAAGLDQTVPPTSVVTLNGGSSKAFNGKTITGYQWTQVSGPTVTLNNAATATANFTAPATGTLTFRLRVTDNQGRTGDDQASVRVNSAPALAAAPAARSATVGETVTFSVSATDADGDAITYVAGSASNVPVSALSPSGVFSWNTTGYGAGSYTLAYFATDGLANSATQTVSITLTGGSAANPPTSSGGGGGGSWSWAGVGLLLSLLLLRAATARHQRKRNAE